MVRSKLSLKHHNNQLLAYLTSPGGGLLHLSFGLLHQKEAVRESTVDIFDQLRQHPVRLPCFHDRSSIFGFPLSQHVPILFLTDVYRT